MDAEYWNGMVLPIMSRAWSYVEALPDHQYAFYRTPFQGMDQMAAEKAYSLQSVTTQSTWVTDG